MDQLLNNIYKVHRDPDSGGWGYSYLLKRPQGNIFLPRMARTATIANELDAIEKAGGISAIYVTDFHFAGTGLMAVAERFDVPIQCSHIEQPKLHKRGITQMTPFPFEHHAPFSDWEVIPTPGHTSGGVCFLWQDNNVRYLFTGDFLYNRNGKWVVGSKSLSKVVASLEVIRQTEFEYLVGCGEKGVEQPYLQLDAAERNRFIDSIIATV